MPAPYKRFVQWWLLLTAVALAAIAALNVLVDPAGAFPRLHLKAFEPLRYLNHDRVHKSEMARRGDWQVIILGSSRAKAGLPATHPFLATNRTCNLSVDGARCPELAGIFDYAVAHNPLKHVILCLDLYMFSQGPRWILDFSESRFGPGFQPFEHYSKQLLGRASTDDSWHALRAKWRNDLPPPQDRCGFYRHSLHADTSQRELFGRILPITGGGYPRLKLDPANLALFRHIVRTCRDRGIDLQVAILPVHALEVEMIHASGRWPEFEEWKTDLVNVLAAEGVEGKFNFWDFTGFTGPSAEPVPPPGDSATRMKYYFENSHFTPVFGGMIIDAMFGPSTTNQIGIALSRSNLQEHLARIREDRSTYVRTNSADIQWVGRIVADLTAKPHQN
jgi:hypothetical protein